MMRFLLLGTDPATGKPGRWEIEAETIDEVLADGRERGLRDVQVSAIRGTSSVEGRQTRHGRRRIAPPNRLHWPLRYAFVSLVVGLFSLAILLAYSFGGLPRISLLDEETFWLHALYAGTALFSCLCFFLAIACFFFARKAASPAAVHVVSVLGILLNGVYPVAWSILIISMLSGS